MLAAITHRLSRLGAHVGTCALFLIMSTATLDVVSRNFFGKSIPGILESAEVILVIGVFLGMAYAQRLKAHVSTSLIVELFPENFGRFMRATGLLVVIIYVALATWKTGERAWHSFLTGEMRFGLIEIPQWPARAAIAIGFALLLLELIRDLRRILRGKHDATDASLGAI
ncbi:MAG TPA: TRAP transporter small permease [Rhizobiaceae bacterium]|nr:TRAP transporter small permease [Rhizobiaceae bacterium]